jgi:energy-coupling factor transporter transmembrane protein EcfT
MKMRILYAQSLGVTNCTVESFSRSEELEVALEALGVTAEWKVTRWYSLGIDTSDYYLTWED